jgi:hypothetical protein
MVYGLFLICEFGYLLYKTGVTGTFLKKNPQNEQFLGSVVKSGGSGFMLGK